MAASCCPPGATLLFLMNLLLKEAEDTVPEVKHSFFIKFCDDMRAGLGLLHGGDLTGQTEERTEPH